jgi:hypothetical protein
MPAPNQPRHAAPDPLATIRTPRFWLSPIIVTLVVFSALAALYLGGILNPTTNLRHFPVTVVNEDAGPYGKQIVDGLVSGLNADEFDVRVLSADEAHRQLDGVRPGADPGRLLGRVATAPGGRDAARTGDAAGPHHLHQPAGR